jgi:hypothetical protein
MALGSRDNISAILVLFKAAPSQVHGHVVGVEWGYLRAKLAVLPPKHGVLFCLRPQIKPARPIYPIHHFTLP